MAGWLDRQASITKLNDRKTTNHRETKGRERETKKHNRINGNKSKQPFHHRNWLLKIHCIAIRMNLIDIFILFPFFFLPWHRLQFQVIFPNYNFICGIRSTNIHIVYHSGFNGFSTWFYLATSKATATTAAVTTIATATATATSNSNILLHLTWPFQI